MIEVLVEIVILIKSEILVKIFCYKISMTKIVFKKNDSMYITLACQQTGASF